MFTILTVNCYKSTPDILTKKENAQIFLYVALLPQNREILGLYNI